MRQSARGRFWIQSRWRSNAIGDSAPQRPTRFEGCNGQRIFRLSLRINSLIDEPIFKLNGRKLSTWTQLRSPLTWQDFTSEPYLLSNTRFKTLSPKSSVHWWRKLPWSWLWFSTPLDFRLLLSATDFCDKYCFCARPIGNKRLISGETMHQRQKGAQLWNVFLLKVLMKTKTSEIKCQKFIRPEKKIFSDKFFPCCAASLRSRAQTSSVYPNMFCSISRLYHLIFIIRLFAFEEGVILRRSGWQIAGRCGQKTGMIARWNMELSPGINCLARGLNSKDKLTQNAAQDPRVIARASFSPQGSQSGLLPFVSLECALSIFSARRQRLLIVRKVSNLQAVSLLHEGILN